jgi:hypothetical protein
MPTHGLHWRLCSMKELRSKIAIAAVLAGCVLLGSGCGPPADLYGHRINMAPAASISPPPTWRLSGSIRDVGLAVDGDLSTGAVFPLINDDSSITIDLQKACLFNMVIIHHGSLTDGYCGRAAVLTSLDGKNFTPQIEVPGTRGTTSLPIIKPTLARYVKLKAIRQGPGAWSLAEIYIQ